MDEYQAAFNAYRAAQARLNNAAAFLTLERWMAQVGQLRGTLPAQFIMDTTSTLYASRRIARRLGQAWYQYARALDSGFQLGELEDGEESGTLNQLRDNFHRRLEEIANLGERDSSDTNSDVKRFERELRESDYSEHSGNRRSSRLDRRPLDRHIQDWESARGAEDTDLQREDWQWRTDTDREQVLRWVREKLQELADEKTRERRDTLRERERDEESEDPDDEDYESAHEGVGQSVAGEVHEATADAVRKLHEEVAMRDRRVRRVARGTSATPCAFCAMLASRGFVYRSAESAWVSGFRRVHPNCNCYPIIRWFNVPDTAEPELNKEFRRIWHETGDFKSFRREIYRRNKQLIRDQQG